MTAISAHSHAIVMGGSIGGMLSARVLSDFFDYVTIIERDPLPHHADHRNGTPQALHLHILLAEGQRIVENLFPNIAQELDTVGAPQLRWGVDTLVTTPEGDMPNYDAKIQTNLITRTTWEHLIRENVRKVPNIRIMEQSEAVGLLANEDNTRIVGVQVENRKTRTQENLYADLVVDTCGRGSKTPEWLETLGYQKPEETVVNCFLGYATRWYHIPKEHAPQWEAIFTQPRPKQGLYRGGGLFHVDGDRYVCTLGGANKDYPPTTETEFMDYAQSLSAPYIYQALQHATPTSQIYGYRRTENRLRHYEKMAQRPENLVMLGDAVCGFNPYYGHGMSMAAKGAQVLQGMFGKYRVDDLEGFAGDFQKRLVKAIDGAWQMATSEDLRYPLCESNGVNPLIALNQRYTDLITNAVNYDPHIAVAFMRVMNLEKHPRSMLRLDLFARIVWQNIKRRLMASKAPQATALPVPQAS